LWIIYNSTIIARAEDLLNADFTARTISDWESS
jgi:hypothetical protein